VHAPCIAARLEAAARATSYRQLAEFLKATTGDPRWSHQKLRRFERAPKSLSAAELVQLVRMLDAPPVGRKLDRRLEDDLDCAREVVNARDPWMHYHREAARYVEERDGMTSAARRRAWRSVDRRYQECGDRNADGRPTDPDYQLTLNQAVYRLTAPHDTVASNEVTRQKRFVQRRIDGRKVDGEVQPSNPRARVVLEQLRALRASAYAVIEQPFLELARAARWAHTVEQATAEAPVWAERSRRAYEELRRRAVETLCQQITETARAVVACPASSPLLKGR
jgi:hypothetical protein